MDSALALSAHIVHKVNMAKISLVYAVNFRLYNLLAHALTLSGFSS